MKLQVIPTELRKLAPEMKLLNQRLETFAGQKDGFLGELLKYVLIGSGKRVRPCLVHLASSLGHAHIEEVRRIAQAVELIHIATLIHDDVIDHAVLRRAQPTVAAKFGDENAVLLGDYVYAEAFRELAALGRPELLKMFAETTSIMCEGEILQVRNRFRVDLSEKEYFSFINSKTASLFEASCTAGGILGGLTPEQTKSVGRVGYHLGMAFQITDDLLDITGEEDLVGKTLNTDLVYGKMTLPLIHLRDQKKSTAEQARLTDLVKNPNGHTAELIEWMIRTGSAASAQKVAHHHVEAALGEIAGLPEGHGRDCLRSIAQTLLDRET